MTKKMTKKGSKVSKKFNLLNSLYEGVLQTAEVTRTGTVRLKKADLKKMIEDAFSEAAQRAAGGERIRFPIIGALVRKEVKARKTGKGTNPFTGEPMEIKARPATKKPRWSFPRALKEIFGEKKNW